MATEPTLVGVDPTPEAAATHGLYERHSRRVYGFCLQQLGSREEAEDATQSTFLNAFRALRRGVAPVAESAWLIAIAQNVCLTRLRSSLRRRRVEAPNDLQALEHAVPAPPRGGFDELLRLEDALTEMPVTQRRAILLREWQGLTYREIAQELEMSQAAVETLIFRARQTLAARLEESPRRAPPRRITRWIDLGSAAGWAQGLLAGGTAKAVATAAAVTAVAVTGGAPLRHDAAPPASAAPSLARPAPAVRAVAPESVARLARFSAPLREATRAVVSTRKLAVKRAAPRPRPAAPPVAVAPVATPNANPKSKPQQQAAAERVVQRSEEQAARRSAREERKAAAAEVRAERREEKPDKPPQSQPNGIANGQPDGNANGRTQEKAAEPKEPGGHGRSDEPAAG